MDKIRDYIYELLENDYPATDYRHARQALFDVLEKMRAEGVGGIKLPVDNKGEL